MNPRRPTRPPASPSRDADAPRPGPDIPIIIPPLKLTIAGRQYVTDPISLVAYPEGAPRRSAPETESTSGDNTQLGIAAKVFQLLTALDPENKIRKAPPIKVFLL